MKILLIFSILSFCFILGKINKKKISNSIYIAISAILTPVVLLNKIDNQIFLFFIVSLLFLISIDLAKRKLVKKIIYISTLIYFALVILYLTGILSNKIEIDFQRLFIIDNSSLVTIKRFQQNALYLPNILRPIIYNYFQIFSITFIKILNYLWIDKIINYLGFTTIYLMYLSIPKKKNKYYLIIPLVVILTAVLHRNPNSHLIYLFSLPALISIFIKNITKINKLLMFTIIFISCFYLLL